MYGQNFVPSVNIMIVIIVIMKTCKKGGTSNTGRLDTNVLHNSVRIRSLLGIN